MSGSARSAAFAFPSVFCFFAVAISCSSPASSLLAAVTWVLRVSAFDRCGDTKKNQPTITTTSTASELTTTPMIPFMRAISEPPKRLPSG